MKAMDGNNSSVEGAFTVIVTNVNETPNAWDHTSSLTVAENKVQGTIVGTFLPRIRMGIHYITTWPAEWEMEIIVCLRWIRMVHCELQCRLIMNRIKALIYTVVVLDDSNASEVGSFSVAVTNANEAPNALGHSSALSVLENQASGTIVGTFQAQDPDGNDFDLSFDEWIRRWKQYNVYHGDERNLPYSDGV